MHYFVCLVVLLCVSSEMFYGADKPRLPPEQQEVIDLHNAIRDAARKRDFKVWAPYIADDCIFSDDDGVLVTKAQVIAHDRALPLEYDHNENQRDYVVHLYGNMAVLNVRFTSHEQYTDTDIITEMRETETFVRQNGPWLLVARQWGPLPVNFHRPIAADPGSYKDYVGQYEWRPGLVDIISVKDGKLWSQLTGDAEPEQNFPLRADTFFTKDDLGTVTFSRDAQGRVTGYIYDRDDGQEIHAQKVK